MDEEEINELLKEEGVTLEEEPQGLYGALAANTQDISILPCRDEQPDWMDNEIF